MRWWNIVFEGWLEEETEMSEDFVEIARNLKYERLH